MTTRPRGSRGRSRLSARTGIRSRGTTRGTAFTASGIPSCSNEVTVTADLEMESDPNIALHDLYEQGRVIIGLIKEMDNRLKAVEEKAATISATLKEFNEYFKKYNAASFSIKGSPYEVCSDHGHDYGVLNYHYCRCN